MIRLRILGTIDLRDADGREVREIHSQPKRLAILAYLACQAPGAFVRRDSLLAMFWPELDTERARNALRQSLFHLRRVLGDGVLLNRGDEEVGLDDGHFWADVSGFEAAARQGRWEEALDLYRGELLPGFFASGAAGFEEWLEERRPALMAAAAAGAWQLAERDRRQGHTSTAIAWARRATALAPLDEDGVRRLLALLVASGDRAGAEQAFQAFARRLDQSLGLTPAAATAALLAGATAVPPEAHSVVGPPVPPIPVAEVHGSPPVRRSPSRLRRPLIAAMVSLLGVAVVWPISAWFSDRHRAAGLDPGVLFVAPFRVTGADSSLMYLSTGLVDLVAASLSGGGTPRAVDAGAALQVWEADGGNVPPSDSARAVAAAWRLGARYALLGHALSTHGRVILTGSVMDVVSGESSLVPVVAAPMDSLPQCVEHFVTGIVTRLSGEEALEQQPLSQVPLIAVRAYLHGRQAFRGGEFVPAAASFRDALESDSTFALAAMGLAETLDWMGGPQADQAQRLAWRLRGRLGTRNRAVLTAMLGPRYPAPSPVREVVAAWEQALALAPDRSESWYGLGDVLFHAGDFERIPDPMLRAARAFNRALELDSTSTAPLSHLILLAARQQDTALVRRLAPMLAHHAESDLDPFLRWRIRLALEGPDAAPTPMAELAEMPTPALMRLVGWSQLDGVGRIDADSAAAILLRRARTTEEMAQAQSIVWILAWNEGRVAEAVRLERRAGIEPSPLQFVLEAAEASADADLRAGHPSEVWSQFQVQSWRLWRGEVKDSLELRRLLREVDADRGDGSTAWMRLAAAMLADRLGDADRAVRFAAADSMYGIPGTADFPRGFSVAMSLAREHAGDLEGALAAVARRPLEPIYGPSYLAGSLYHEGRLALLTGDGARALRAWRHYLALRADPDPVLRPQVSRIRALVDSLDSVESLAVGGR